MSHSDERFSLNQLLQNSSGSDPSFRLSLMHHCVEILRELTAHVPLDSPSSAPEEPADTAPAESPEVEVAATVEAPSMLPEYGDEVALDQARKEALDVFDSRSFAVQSYVALWIDSVQVWGHPLILCMGVTMDGYRNFLGFVEAPAQDIASMQRLFRDLMDRGVCTAPGLLCITSRDAPLSKQIIECLNPGAIQYCQVKKTSACIKLPRRFGGGSHERRYDACLCAP